MNAYKRQRGFTLTEVMVAAALFTIIVLAALLVYDRNNKVFKQGVEASELQQNTRIGFDRLVSELRLEGFDYDRDGVPSGSGAGGVNFQEQPDEQIEYMGATAITFRANLNYSQEPDNGREVAYEPAAFPIVTTGNSEIVTYALKSADASKNTQDIHFFADVAKPRKVYSGAGGENSEREVILKGFDLTNNNPPYTLYRITLKDADIADKDANPVGVLAPIVSNVRSLNFTYYEDQAGSTEIAPNLGAGQFVIGGGDIPERTARGQVKSVLVKLVGMNENSDQNYTNTETVAALQHYREVTLTSLIVPRNAGKKSIKEESLTAPGKPTLKSICYGACAVPYITWQAPTSGQVDFYAITYDTDPAGSFAGGFAVGNVTEAYFPLALDPTQTYYFKIQAANGYGQSLSDNMVSAQPIAGTTLSAPGSPLATNGLHSVTLTWTVPTTFKSPATYSCQDPTGAAAGTYAPPTVPSPEHIKYRVWRYEGNKPNFDPATEGTVLASEVIGNQPSIAGGVATLTDVIPACTDFYYRIQAVASDCVVSGALNVTGNTTQSESDIAPPVGTNALHGYATANANPKAPTGLVVTRGSGCPNAAATVGPNIVCDMTFVFNKVTQDMNSQPLKINSYTVTRKQIQPVVGSPITLSVPAGLWSSPGTTVTIADPGVPLTNATGVSAQWQYSVVANDCAFASTAATVNDPACYFAVSPSLTSSAATGNGSAANPYQMQLGDTITIAAAGTTAATAVVKDFGGNVIQTFSGASSPFNIAWPGFTDGQSYTVDVQLKNSSGCYYTFTFWVVDSPGVCFYNNAPTAVPSPAQATTGTQASPYQFKAGNTLKWTASDLKDVIYKITDVGTGALLGPTTATAVLNTATLTWPNLTNNHTYRIDAQLEQTPNCQATQIIFVTQVCTTYSGGAPSFSTSDTNPAHTGLTQPLAYQINVGGQVTISEPKMTTLNLTVTDLTAGTPGVPLTSTGLSGTKTIIWPPAGVTQAFNHDYRLDFVLIDSAGCSSSTVTRFLRQFCVYKSGVAFTLTPSATQTIQPNLKPVPPANAAGTGTSATSPFQMVPRLDQLTLTESSALTKVTIVYKDSSNIVRNTKTVVGTNPIVLTNPTITTPGNGGVYSMDVTLEDNNGCQTATTAATYYMRQVPCAIKVGAAAGDNSIFTTSSGVVVGGTTYNVLNIKLTNQSTFPLTISSIKLDGYSLNGGRRFLKVQFPTASDVVDVPVANQQAGPITVSPATGFTETIPAGGNVTVRALFNTSITPTATTIPKVCVTYNATSLTAITQSCSIEFQASTSQVNPTSCP
jgi:prepilin-type N-terminal cleavage/methylation domain-containing protein